MACADYLVLSRLKHMHLKKQEQNAYKIKFFNFFLTVVAFAGRILTELVCFFLIRVSGLRSLSPFSCLCSMVPPPIGSSVVSAPHRVVPPRSYIEILVEEKERSGRQEQWTLHFILHFIVNIQRHIEDWLAGTHWITFSIVKVRITVVFQRQALLFLPFTDVHHATGDYPLRSLASTCSCCCRLLLWVPLNVI